MFTLNPSGIKLTRYDPCSEHTISLHSTSNSLDVAMKGAKNLYHILLDVYLTESRHDFSCIGYFPISTVITHVSATIIETEKETTEKQLNALESVDPKFDLCMNKFSRKRYPVY